jgi:hypothetical protein
MHVCMYDVCIDTLCTQVSICACAQADATRIDGCTCISRHPFSIYVHHPFSIYVHGHPSIFRYMYFGAALRRACGRAFAADAPAWAASALGYNHRSECTGVPITCMRVCVRACVVTFHGFARSTPRLPIVARRARPHVREGHGRSIYSTKVKALPESLGQCKLLQYLCVAPAAAPPPCAFAVVPALCRCACAAAPGARPHHAALVAAAAVLPVVGRGRAPRVQGWRARPTGVRQGVGPEPPGAAERWRAGGRTTPSSRRCRRRSSGPT